MRSRRWCATWSRTPMSRWSGRSCVTPMEAYSRRAAAFPPKVFTSGKARRWSSAGRTIPGRGATISPIRPATPSRRSTGWSARRCWFAAPQSSAPACWTPASQMYSEELEWQRRISRQSAVSSKQSETSSDRRLPDSRLPTYRLSPRRRDHPPRGQEQRAGAGPALPQLPARPPARCAHGLWPALCGAAAAVPARGLCGRAGDRER